MMLATSPFRFAGSNKASTSTSKAQPENTGPEKESDKPEISLSWLRRQIRGLPQEIKNLCIPRQALAEDILELSRTAAPTDVTALKIRDSNIDLLTRHSTDKGENDHLLHKSLIQGQYPVFERLLKTFDTPKPAPIIKIAAFINHRDAFEKILEKAPRTKYEVPEATLQFVADCGQVDFLRKLFSSVSTLPTNRKKALWKKAIAQRNCINDLRNISPRERSDVLKDMPKDESGSNTLMALTRSSFLKHNSGTEPPGRNYIDFINITLLVDGVQHYFHLIF